MDAPYKSLPILAAGGHDTAIDPVCGMTVDKASAQHTLEHEGARYYFCCRTCRDKFAANPSAFLARTPAQKSCCGDAPSNVPAASVRR